MSSDTSTRPHSITLRIAVAWGDMDALAHVNNTVYLRWFESARIVWWERLGLSDRPQVDGIGPILARTAIDYRRPVTYPDTVEVNAKTLRVGSKSVTLGYEVRSSAQGGAVVAAGETVLVLFDYHRKTPLPIDDALRRKMETGGEVD